jgi:UDP-glucuronate 4-epimerase
MVHTDVLIRNEGLLLSDPAKAQINTESPMLVTGAAGFIGFHVARRLLAQGHRVVGVDNLTPYYDVSLKRARLAELAKLPGFTLLELDLADAAATAKLFSDYRFARVIHLAAQPGVRAALTDPGPYIQRNVVAFLNIIEGCRHSGSEHLVYASSSSVYGLNGTRPFSEHHGADHPTSLYAATKKANELMAHAYAHLFGVPMTGLRFFTVYGPWGRPDMAVYTFTHAIAQGRPINVANDGAVWRDFTYIDDVVEGVVRVANVIPAANPNWDAAVADPATSSAAHRVFNIGNDSPEKLDDLISMIETALGKRAIRIAMPLPPGDVLATRADITDLRQAVGFAPATPLHDGVARFVEWYRAYHGSAA